MINFLDKYNVFDYFRSEYTKLGGIWIFLFEIKNKKSMDEGTKHKIQFFKFSGLMDLYDVAFYGYSIRIFFVAKSVMVYQKYAWYYSSVVQEILGSTGLVPWKKYDATIQ